WSNYSDSRLKKDIATSTYGLNFINKLRPVTYKMKTGTTELQSGFIAQEVETTANSIGYQFSGIVKPQNDSDYYSLRYSEFVVPLVKAVQEQQKLIEDQQTQISEQQKLLGAKDAKILEIENRLLKLEQKLK
ncbi:tail fiber domain-containing protein, partial [Flavobacterium ginsenosidimutans]|uniref:tail fiber domain-containing protein n=1 Tax=Flavobacterium ginsenosidimutans TaxID=687844 RepID=UPI00194E994E